MTEPRKAKFSQSQTFTWSNGQSFDGAAIIGLVIPTQSGTAETVWPMVNYGNTDLPFALPKSFARIPIKEGVLSNNLGLFYNDDITPPNTQYVHYIIDANEKVIAGPGTFFTVSTTPITLPTLTLTAPTTTNAVAPVPN
ncbi:hypothetical protein UFOVP434_48 [uncultured Caudovirales phage]|uniref:Uncharacterized protein n=1 Tax=uncultured Caudovirales phage TaxID=2100421 RepID=A0A6J5M8A1_9CAUD|nr:hypothetical protein UFOVP434_48 [uncultured Caudovirales phage]